MFETAEVPFGIRSVTVHGTLYDGSSKHGNARRASADSNWVNAYQSPPSFWRKSPCVEVSSMTPSNARRRVVAPGSSGRSNASPTNSVPPGIARADTERPPCSAEAPAILSSFALSQSSSVFSLSRTSIAIVPWNAGRPGSIVRSRA